ncbi:MAG: stage III sporulation protein AE [Roseburia sp.]|nr:stage III sporulation protein AE [Roseburia sp.]
MRKLICFIFLCFTVVWGAKPVTAFGQEPESLVEELDFSDIGDFLKNTKETENLSFGELVEMLISGEELPYEKVGDWLKDTLLEGFQENRTLFLEIIVLSLAFSILKNFAKSFSNTYITEVSFLIVYCFFMILLLQSFFELNSTVIRTVGNMLEFMKIFLPTYCLAISFTLNINSSGAVYSMIFGAIYLVEWMLRYFLMPLIQIYVLVEFLNHLTEEERFKRLAELIYEGVKMILKLSASFVLGINIIQGMVAPAIDMLSGNSIAKTVQMLPGIGNVMSGMGQIFISSGIVIKNCVGAAALVILVLLCAVPFLKMSVMALLYKLMSAVLEPVADKRIAGGMNGIAGGAVLYLKVISTCMMLFFLTIALCSAATNLNV